MQRKADPGGLFSICLEFTKCTSPFLTSENMAPWKDGTMQTFFAKSYAK